MSERHSVIKSHWLAISILVAHLALGVLYSVAVPIWESYDEWGHYSYVGYIATEHALPRIRLVEHNDETHQPPLYYILGALATFWIDTSDAPEMIENQYSVHRGGEGGINFYLHLEAESFPYHGTVLAIHITRLVSVLLSTIAVWATYLIGCALFPEEKEIALGAMAVNAFWPQFLFVGSVVTNDIMITTCASLVLLFLVRILIHKRRALDLFGLGLCLGAGLMSKRNGLVLVPLTLVALAIVITREVRKRKVPVTFLGWGLLFLAGVALISAWWFKGLMERYQGYIVRIISLLSHPSQVGQLHWERLPSALYFCLTTFFAAFGHLIVGVEVWIYKLVALVFLVACLGLIIFFAGKKSSRLVKIGIVILVLHLLSVLSAPAYLTLTSGGISSQGPTIAGPVALGEDPIVFHNNVFAFQGRFVLPAISAVSLLLLVGLASLVPERYVGVLAACAGLALFIFATLVPFHYILPVYARPALLSPSEVQDLEHPLGITFGDKIELLGYEADRQEVAPGERAPVTLYWRCLSEMEQNYALAVDVLGYDHLVYGGLRLHPGRGNFPTSTWRKGDVFRETYWLRISPDVPAPSLAQISVYFFVPSAHEGTLSAFNADGTPSNATFGRLIIRSQEQSEIEAEIENPVYYKLGSKIALVGYKFDTLNKREGEVKVTLYWRALAGIERDYTVFVHLMDEDGLLEAQGDSQPRGGIFPTSVWKEGELIKDEHLLSLSPGGETRQYQVVVGMYNLATMERLAVFDADGSRLLHDAIVLGEMEVEAVP